MTGTRAGRLARCAGQALAVAALVASAATLAFLVAWRATGGRWFVVETPSMGAAAPVGTLLLDRPAGRLHVGELISFRLPDARIFTHRIVSLLPGGGIRTRGDINSAVDGWILTRNEILGRVDLRVWGAGWLVRALPILLCGAAVVVVVSRLAVRDRSRTTVHLAGGVLVVSVAVLVLHPLFGAKVMAIEVGQGRGAASVVSTGLLPVEVTAVGGSRAVVADGHVGSVHNLDLGRSRRFDLRVRPHWTLAEILFLVVIAFAPGLWYLLVGVPERPELQAA